MAKPIKLSLRVLPSRIHKGIHDLAYREAVRSAQKILWDPDISRAITDMEGRHVVPELRAWLRAVAQEQVAQADPTLDIWDKLRVGTTMVGMGFRVSTALAQFLGLLPAMTRVKSASLMSGVLQIARQHNATVAMVNSMSGEMRHRFNRQDREINDTVRTLLTKRTVADKIRAAAFVHIGAMDRIVATATWLGAYQDQLELTPGNQDLAIQAADRTVRLTQGTGTIKDFAGVMNRRGFQSLFTMFYSYFSAQYAMQSRLTRQTIRDIKKLRADPSGENWGAVMNDLMNWQKLVVIPAVLGALITGQGPGEDEEPLAWFLRKTLLYPFSAVPLVREFTGSIEGFNYRLSPAAKAGEQASKALYHLIPDERRDWHPEKAIEPGAAAASILLRIPSDQFINSTEALWKGVANDDLTLGDLLYGRREE